MERATEERLITAEDIAALPDDELRYELVAGHLTSEPPASYRHGDVAVRVLAALHDFNRTRKLGKLLSADTGFLLARDPDTVRAPDVAFLSKERVKAAGAVKGFFPGAPDLAVEVLSPSDRTGEVRGKVADYLAAGTRMVWLVDPSRARVTVYRSLLSPRTLTAAERLDGEDVLPGFEVPIAQIFEE